MKRTPLPPRSRAQIRAVTIARLAQAETRRLDALAAMADYEAARRALARNIERLKALRLARDATQTQQQAQSPKQHRQVKH